MSYLFQNREQAGKILSSLIIEAHLDHPVLLALPRGGVVLAEQISKKMGIGYDVLISRKIGSPYQPEFGIGAISEDEVPYFSSHTMNTYEINHPFVKENVQHEIFELRRRKKIYRQNRELENLKGRTVVLIDDGLATGVTAVAATKFLRKSGVKEIILAVPLGPEFIDAEVEKSFDRIICPFRLQYMASIGQWYEEFPQVSDDEVLKMLSHTRRSEGNPDEVNIPP